jgi:pyridoxal phosphate enzyme (YggS family)
VTLCAVTKTKPLEDLLAAYEAGVRHFGENRVQEAEAKFPQLPSDAVRHLIGPIQSNKANKAARLAGVLHAVDSADLARRLARAAGSEGRRLVVYLEVNTGGEETKAGVPPAAAPALVEAIRGLPELELAGLMAIPPPGDTRPHFASLGQLARALGLTGLSMGMSDDFEVAIEEGATVVRIGTALFGSRSRA